MTFGQISTNVTQEPKASSTEQESQGVKRRLQIKISIRRPNFGMPAWGNVNSANLLATMRMGKEGMPRLKI